MEILHHARQTVLFKDGEVWRKKKSLFDVSMGAYDGAEEAELVGLLILSNEMHEVNLLDVTFNLAKQYYKPYRKPNDTPLYIHRSSNHPPTVKKQLQ